MAGSKRRAAGRRSRFGRTWRDTLFDAVNYTLLAILSFTFLFPFWRVIMIAFNEGLDSIRGGIYLWFRKFTLDNFKLILSRSEVFDAYGITLFRTVVGSLASVLLMAMMAYALSKPFIRGRRVLNAMLMFTMFFGGGMIPSYLLYNQLHLLNTVWIYIFPMLYSAYNVFVMRTFFRAMPLELEEAASIDGAGDGTIFFRLVVPMSKPILATMILFCAVAHWNDYMTAVLYTSDKSIQPLQTFLFRLMNEQKSAQQIALSGQLLTGGTNTITSLSVQMAALVVVVVPIMCIYPFLQKYFVKGVMIGSLKG